MDKLRSLEIFLATCDGGSFAAAARACNSDPSTVSKAVSRLEEELGLILFQRSTRKLSITSAGSHYASTVRQLIQNLSSCEDDLKHANDSPCGTLRINAAVCYGHLYLRPLLKAFCTKYPDIKLELEINDLHIDIIENNIDVAIRTGFVKDSRLIARQLSPMDFLTCVAPSYVEQYGIPKCAQDFQKHSWIGFRFKQTQQLQPILLPDLKGQYVSFEMQRTHTTDDGETMANMCIDGLGFAQLPHFLARDGLKNGKLISLYPYFRPTELDCGVFAIYPKRDYLPAKVRVFIEFVIAWLGEIGEDSTKTWARKIKPVVNFQQG